MNRFKIGFFSVLIIIGFVFLSFQVWAAEHAKVNVRIISAPFGTMTYVLGSALEDISKKHHPWLRFNHSESPGYVYNMKKIGKEPEVRKDLIIGTGPVLNYLAKKGLPPFDQKYEGVKLLAVFALNARWLGTLNPDIKTIKDLEGKKIALGRKPQINFAFNPDAILRDGWGIKDKIKIQYLGTKPAIAALMDGLVDAAIVGGYINPAGKYFQPGPPTLELIASGKKVFHIPWGDEQVKKTIAMGLPIIPFKVPAGTLKGLDSDLSVFANTLTWCASSEFPEELAYEFVKLNIENVSKFKEYHSLGKLVSKELFSYGWDEKDIHPGAIKAFKEFRLLN